MAWGRLGASWGRLGASWERLGRGLGRLGAVLERLERRLGSVLGGVMGRLRPSRGVLAPLWSVCSPIFVPNCGTPSGMPSCTRFFLVLVWFFV